MPSAHPPASALVAASSHAKKLGSTTVWDRLDNASQQHAGANAGSRQIFGVSRNARDRAVERMTADAPNLRPVRDMTPSLQFRSIHGYQCACRIAGSGPAIVLIHGLGGNLSTWNTVQARLAHRFTVIAPDLLGHGKRDKPRTDSSVAAYANGLRDLLSVLGIDRFSLVGHSLGAAKALAAFAELIARATARSSVNASSEQIYEPLDHIEPRLPRTLIHVSGSEVLLHDAQLCARELAAAEVPVEIRIWPGPDTCIPGRRADRARSHPIVTPHRPVHPQGNRPQSSTADTLNQISEVAGDRQDTPSPSPDTASSSGSLDVIIHCRSRSIYLSRPQRRHVAWGPFTVVAWRPERVAAAEPADGSRIKLGISTVLARPGSLTG